MEIRQTNGSQLLDGGQESRSRCVRAEGGYPAARTLGRSACDLHESQTARWIENADGQPGALASHDRHVGMQKGKQDERLPAEGRERLEAGRRGEQRGDPAGAD